MNKLLILVISMTVAVFSFGCAEEATTVSSEPANISVVDEPMVENEATVDELMNDVADEPNVAVEEAKEPVNAVINEADTMSDEATDSVTSVVDEVNVITDETTEAAKASIDEVNTIIEEMKESINTVAEENTTVVDKSVL